jgi:elongation factor G
LLSRRYEAGGAVLLEPIGELKVMIPDSMMGDIIGDLNKRRGRIMAPSRAIARLYSCSGRGSVCRNAVLRNPAESNDTGQRLLYFRFARYEEAPAEVAQKVIAEAKKEQTEE